MTPGSDPAARWAAVAADDGLLLRAVTVDDAPGILSINSDPRVYEFDPHLVHHDLAQTREFLRPLAHQWSDRGMGYWAVLVPRDWWADDDPRLPVTGLAGRDGDRVYAGMGGVQHHLLLGQTVLNVYFRLAPAVQGRGLARRIVETGLLAADDLAPRLDVVIRTRPANAAARRVAERAGFVDEGLEPGGDGLQLYRRSAGSHGAG